MTTPRIVISGGGIAGTALGVALGRRGIAATVLERAAGPRIGGHTVDLRGHSQQVLREWGLLDDVLALRVAEERMVAVGRDGRELWRMPAQVGGIVADVEIGREDLNAVLAKASTADVHYGEFLVEAAGPRVKTSRGRQLDADLVVLAEGTRSASRARLFPAAKEHYLGGYLAFVAVPYPREFGSDMRMFAVGGGVMVAIRPGRVGGQALIAVRAPRREELAREVAAQREFIVDSIERAGIACDWHLPSVLDAVAHDPGFYCDEMVKVTVPSWSAERTVLLGDSAWAGSPLTGLGTAMAIMGAEALAAAIATGDLRSYETRMRQFVHWGHRDATPATLKRWAPDTARQVRMNAMAMRMFTRTPLRRLLARADNLPPWYA
ncbi:FAD-dependent oxidoreductase [Amycolatopsis sp. WGS_07]|uniref:FAD-dependent oxidoreductase n=1 Tax=Amycolatopsis sp. WGS_07 TaxID=3076764 RepID=UPI003873649B